MVSETTKPRRWWIAAVFTLINPIIGYLYVGRPARVLIAMLVLALFDFALWHAPDGWLAKPVVGIPFFAAGLLFPLFAIVDCVTIALRSKAYCLRPWNRWWVYLGACAAIFAAGFWATDWATDSKSGLKLPIGVYVNSSTSMLPTLISGERVVADLLAYDSRDPGRGDVVVFRNPRNQTKVYVRRVIGLPGDEVEMMNGVLHLNGVAVPMADGGFYLQSPPGSQTSEKTPIKQETLPNGRRILVLQSNTSGPGDDMPVTKVSSNTKSLKA